MNLDINQKLDELLSMKYETETVEFKEAKDNFSFDDLGKYFSALSNEANLHNEKYAWLVFGVEDKKHNIVGTNYKNDDKSLLALKEEMGKQTTGNLTFIEIHKCFRKNKNNEEKRILVFQIPAAPCGMPVAFKRMYYGRDGVVRDYEHFYCPLIVSAEKVKAKIRNLTYRYMTGDSIFPKETLQYDPYIIREALNNAIAHQDYLKAGRITVQEHEDDYLIFCNCGDFIPGSIKNVLKAEYSASNYRNPFLATAMVNLNMIDTVGSGILKMFLAQKKRCFPLPDYDFSNHEVRMKLYGKILDINYTRRLLNEDLPLSEVFELDRKQKEEFNSHRNDPVKEQVKEQVKSLILVLDGEKSKKELVELLNLKGLRNFSEKYTSPALEGGFIELTQPDSPNSPTQKYRLTAKGLALKKEILEITR